MSNQTNPDHLPKHNAWSFTELRRQYGEDGALAMLSQMRGYGQFRHNQRGPQNESEGMAPDDSTKGCPWCGGSLTDKRGCWAVEGTAKVERHPWKGSRW